MGSLFLMVKEAFDIVTSKVIRAPALFLPQCCHFLVNYLPATQQKYEIILATTSHQKKIGRNIFTTV